MASTYYMDPERDNPELTEERRRANFDPEVLGDFFWQGQLKRRRQICEYVRSQGAKLAPAQPVPFMTRMEKLEDVARLVSQCANFGVVMAQLYTNGKCHGAHPFWVQLRDIDSHKPLPGITVGDIGPKFGIGSNDNGFLRFDNYRIPRRHMLMKHAKVLPSGEYVPPMHAKIFGNAVYLACAITIAIRYSCIRRQGEIRPGYELLQCAAALFEDSFMSAQQMEYVRIKMYDSMQRIRPIALTVVDSFDFTDAELKSVLGRRDGNVYEHLLEWAKQSPINANDVLPFHEKYLGSFMKEVREEREMSKI
uniref:ACOX domain-containing protein n=1 Tax=Globodera pallida TaxID=36090 RepID=A0A183BKU5_GLOPA